MDFSADIGNEFLKWMTPKRFGIYGGSNWAGFGDARRSGDELSPPVHFFVQIGPLIPGIRQEDFVLSNPGPQPEMRSVCAEFAVS